jgi:hypothetical protein
MIKLLVIASLLFFQSVISAQVEIKATLSSDTDKALEFGGTYNFNVTIHPYDLDKVTEEIKDSDELVPFIHITKMLDIHRSENNYDAVVVNFKGILTSKYSMNKNNYIKVGSKYIPIQLNIPSHGNEVVETKEFILLGHEKPREDINLGLIIFGLIITLIIIFYFLYNNKNEKKTLYKELCDELSKYTDKKQLEYLYSRRKEIMSINSETKEFFDKIGQLQYRINWPDIDKTELIVEKDKVIEGLNGVR